MTSAHVVDEGTRLNLWGALSVMSETNQRETMGGEELKAGWRRAVPFHNRWVSEKTYRWDGETEMGVNHGLAETAKVNDQNYSPPAPSLLNHPSHPGLYRKRLLRQFSLFLGPINNVICCHTTMLRPGVQLPNQLNKYFFSPCLQWIRFIKPNLTTRTERQLTSHKWRRVCV